MSKLMHRVRDPLRGQQLRKLYQHRPRQCDGMRVLKDVLNKQLHKYPDGVEHTLLLGAIAGATWTADRAHLQGLRTVPQCQYREGCENVDEDHLSWRCSAWEVVREPLAMQLVQLAKGMPWLREDPKDWPPCQRLCCLPPVHMFADVKEEVVHQFVEQQLAMFYRVLRMR